jgi:hypothetical protein
LKIPTESAIDLMKISSEPALHSTKIQVVNSGRILAEFCVRILVGLSWIISGQSNLKWSTNRHQIGTAVQKGKGIPYVSLSRIASFQSENHHSNIVFLHQMERSFPCGLKKESI